MIAPLSELPSKKNKMLQEPNKASTQVELEGSLDMTTIFFKTEQESTSSNCDVKGTRDAQTFHWFQKSENWDDLCPPQEEANKKDMVERHTPRSRSDFGYNRPERESQLNVVVRTIFYAHSHLRSKIESILKRIREFCVHATIAFLLSIYRRGRIAYTAIVL